jgi:hypothetical protein
LNGSNSGSESKNPSEVGEVNLVWLGDGGNGGRSRGLGGSSVKLCLRRSDKLSMFLLRMRSYNEGRAFSRGRRPTFINLSIRWRYRLNPVDSYPLVLLAATGILDAR